MKSSKRGNIAPRLVALGQTGPGQFRWMDRIAKIGGESEDLLLDDLNVSSSRPEISRTIVLDRFLLRDLNSRNGTFLNDEKVLACALNRARPPLREQVSMP